LGGIFYSLTHSLIRSYFLCRHTAVRCGSHWTVFTTCSLLETQLTVLPSFWVQFFHPMIS